MRNIAVIRRFDCPINRYSSDELIISIRCRMIESFRCYGKVRFNLYYRQVCLLSSYE